MTPRMRTPRPAKAEAPTVQIAAKHTERDQITPAVCAIACGRVRCPWVCPGGAS